MSKAWRILAWTLLALVVGMAARPAAAEDSPVNFVRPTLDGARLTLSQLRGRVVIIDVFATWCRPCKESLPKVNELYHKYKDRGISVLGYAVDKEGRELVKPFAARLGLEFPIVLGTVAEAKELFGARVLPTTVVIDPQGRVAYRFEGVTSHAQIMGAALPLADGDAPPPPKAAAGTRLRGKDERRIRELWVTDNEVLSGRRGLYVHVVADVADLTPEQGLWLGLNLQPEARSGGGTTPLGPVKTLYQRVDRAVQEYFILFVQCDQLPAIPNSGLYRTWISILGSQQQVIEESAQFHLGQACEGRVLAQADTATYRNAETARPSRAKSQPPREGGVVGWSASVPLDTESTGASVRLPEETAAPQAPPAVRTPEQPVAPQAPEKPEIAAWEGRGGRVEAVKVTADETLDGKPGVFVHVLADAKGLDPSRGAWLTLDLRPEGPGGRAHELSQKITDAGQHYFILFVACDQLPDLAKGGGYQATVSLRAGKGREELGSSGPFRLQNACAGRGAR